MDQLFNIDFERINSSNDKEKEIEKKILNYFYKEAFQIKKMKIGNFLI